MLNKPNQISTISQHKSHVWKELKLRMNVSLVFTRGFVAGRLCVSDIDTKGYLLVQRFSWWHLKNTDSRTWGRNCNPAINRQPQPPEPQWPAHNVNIVLPGNDFFITNARVPPNLTDSGSMSWLAENTLCICIIHQPISWRPHMSEHITTVESDGWICCSHQLLKYCFCLVFL